MWKWRQTQILMIKPTFEKLTEFFFFHVEGGLLKCQGPLFLNVVELYNVVDERCTEIMKTPFKDAMD